MVPPAPQSPGEMLERLRSLKARLQALRDAARRSVEGGTPVPQTASLISDSIDRLLIDLFEAVFARSGPAAQQVLREDSAVIAVGGSGRGELVPYSDVDLLFLVKNRKPPGYDEVVSQIVRDCWDAGIQLGHRVASLSDAVNFAGQDPVFATALVQTRLLWGSEALHAGLRTRYDRAVCRGRYTTFYRNCLAARAAERAQYGGTDRQLEPDVKRSPGGLRDVQLVQWIGYAAHGTPDLDLLRLGGHLDRSDADRLVAGSQFLLRIRTELHFHAGKPQEILTREEQVRLAGLFGFPGDAAQRPVEQFMRQYLLHVTAIADIATRFVHRNRPGQLGEQFRRFCTSRRDNLYFQVTPREIFPTRRSRELVLNNPGLLLQMYELAAGYRVKVPADLGDSIRQAAAGWPQPPAPEVAERFLSILRNERGVGGVLRELFAVGLLEYVLPEFQHVRCLLQFNQYHAYTVDEHTLRAIEAAETLLDQRGVLAETARGLRRRDLLHLALLLHDAAKGYVEDHCVLGEELARRVGPRLGLPAADTDTVAFLVRQHLSMTVTAFRRDLNDPTLLLEFARQVGGAERLRLLFVHSAADMLAVGPHTFTSWKEDLLGQLYEGALANLTGTATRDLTPLRRELALRLRGDAGGGAGAASVAMPTVERGTAAVAAPGPTAADPSGKAGAPAPGEPAIPTAEAVAAEGSATGATSGPEASPADWALVESLPAHYLTATPPEQVLEDLRIVRELDRVPLSVTGRQADESRVLEFRIITADSPGSGLFSRLCGTLTARGLSILTANICTTTQQVAIDRFQVLDEDFSGPSPEFRIREVEESLRQVVSGGLSVEQLFERSRRLGPLTAMIRDPQLREPPRVVIDNQVSETATVIDVFAHDVRGLLYQIARALFELGVSVSLAKITTHVDQVLDVFYVTTMEGQKLADADLPALEVALLERVRACQPG